MRCPVIDERFDTIDNELMAQRSRSEGVCVCLLPCCSLRFSLLLYSSLDLWLSTSLSLSLSPSLSAALCLLSFASASVFACRGVEVVEVVAFVGSVPSLAKNERASKFESMQQHP